MKSMKVALTSAIALSFSLFSAKANAQFSLGLRTGVNYQMKEAGYYHTPNSQNTLSWSQQLLADWNIVKHFLLEINLIHATFNKDVYPFYAPPGTAIAIREQSFNLNSLFSYKVLGLKAFELYGGLGLGAYTYTTSNQFNLDAPSGLAAISAYYALNQKIKLTAQPFYSILLSSGSNAIVSNTGLNVGATMRL